MENLIINHTLQYIVDEDSKLVTDDVRVFRDVSTSAFVEVFLSDKNTRHMFIDYCWNVLNAELSNLGTELVKLNLPLLYSDEDVKLIFKGGTVMNYHLTHHITKGARVNISTNKIIDDLKKVNNPKINPINQTFINNNTENFFKDIGDNFKISDIDFSLYIITKDVTRYRLLYDICTRLLHKGLERITNFFESLFNNTYIELDAKYINMYKRTYDFKLHPSQSCTINIIKSQFYTKENIKNNDVFLNDDQVDELYGTLSTFRNMPHSSDIFLLVEYKKLLQYVKETHVIRFTKISDLFKDFTINYNRISKHIDRILRIKEYEIYKKDFYTPNKIALLKNKIVEGLNKLLNKKKYKVTNKTFDNVINEIELKQNVGTNNIIIKKRSNTYVLNHYDKVEQYKINKSTNESIHYISFNNTINIKASKKNKGFKLIRIKFNIECDRFTVDNNIETIKIPSEFLDISIPDFEDGNYSEISKHITDLNYYRFQSVTSFNKPVTYYFTAQSVEDIFNDLIDVIFKQNLFPWIDVKYLKRIKRIMYVGAIYSKNKKKEKEYADFLNLCILLLYDIEYGTNTAKETIVKYFGYSNFSEILNMMRKYYKNYKLDLNALDVFFSSNNIFNIVSMSLLQYYLTIKYINTSNYNEYYNYYRIKNNLVGKRYNTEKQMNDKQHVIDLLRYIVEVGSISYYMVNIHNTNRIIGGKKKSYKEKYLKYKSKYLNIKN